MQEFQELVDVIKKLRSPQGCHWDRAQRISNLKSYILEEVYELIDSLDSRDYEKIKEEIGDLIFLLVSLTQFFEEKNKFKLQEAIKEVKEKLIHRHPHVFANKNLKTKRQILNNWIKTKSKEKKRKDISQRLPKTAPSLLLAYVLFKEKFYLNKHSNDNEPIVELRKIFNQTKINKRSIQKAILKLAQLASYNNLELETVLRKRIFQEAKKIKY